MLASSLRTTIKRPFLYSSINLKSQKSYSNNISIGVTLNQKLYNNNNYSTITLNKNSFLSKEKKTYNFNGMKNYGYKLNLNNYCKTIKVPTMGDSISEGEIQAWNIDEGGFAEMDEVVCKIETDKVTNDIRAPSNGTVVKHLVEEGDVVNVGDDLFIFKEGGKASKSAPKKEEASEKPAAEKPAAKKEAKPASEKQAAKPKAVAQEAPKQQIAPGQERRVKMTRMRKRIAERLKDSQNTAAMLTTFQECDMYNLMNMRSEYKDEFFKKHGVKLGFMSAFVKASAKALMDIPVVNAYMEDNEIVYHDYVDISVAVATPTGLLTPVLRDCNNMSFSDVEKEIIRLANKGREGKISVDELSGGTFTISNGGVYGSLMGTPIINPPQSAILGMHNIEKRPIVVNDEIKIRPVMYLALTYDHRIIDGRDAVTFLRTIKKAVEDPRTLLLDL
eukprot:TRINITY_DN1564_c2_g1_i1.p1 TRINITY_DN1564_c2_g1~~TRINITY_DN1564_c2_g1_i1.p1  ORF type:complete len:446 (+),score=190.06 TRINITY_DN1564_c2_g1_i1:51-1388(+)